jgi:hypothetical protein
MKETKMKLLKYLPRSLFLASAAIGVCGLLVPNLTRAEGKGASRLMFNAPQSTPASATATPKMCPRCDDRFTKVVDHSLKGMRADQLKTVAVHGCPACSTTIAPVGAGKAKADKVSHSCASQGSCCMASR